MMTLSLSLAAGIGVFLLLLLVLRRGGESRNFVEKLDFDHYKDLELRKSGL